MTKKALAPIAPVPGFDAYAKTIAAAAKAAIAAGDKLGAVVAASINAYLDACRQAGVPKNELGCAQLALAIRGSEPLKAAVAAGWLKKTTVSEYGTGAMRAYYHSIPWTASLKNSTDPARTLPWSKKGVARPDDGTDTDKASASTDKPGKVQSTTRKDLDKTICALLQQARLLGLAEFAAEILDLALDALDGFEETI